MAEFGDKTTQTVRKHYEGFPYPDRDPADEHKRLCKPVLAGLDVVNHYCYKGKRDFGKGFRALVAGGGTGDMTIWLGEQLRGTDAMIIDMDISEASIAISKARAKIRGLENIRWIHGSLLDLPTMGLGTFDYINSNGVLHHLSDPPAGLAALRAVLADDGAMGIMVYAQHGRTGVYQMQELMRRINDAGDDQQQKVDNTRAVLKDLPQSNWFKRGEALIGDHLEPGGAGLYDLLLHSQDRAYTVGQLYEFFDGAGLHIVKFATESRVHYKPEHFINDPALLKRISALPLREQQAIGELISGAIIKHSCFVSPLEDTMADLDDPAYIPMFTPEARGGFMTILDRPLWSIQAPPLPAVSIKPGRFTRAAFKLMDGDRSMGEIASMVRENFGNKPTIDEILGEFKPVFDALREWGDITVLRHPDSGKQMRVEV